MAEPGWAAPYGRRFHWWCVDGRVACDPDGLLGYLGAKAVDTEAEAVCADCWDAVAAAALVAGFSPSMSPVEEAAVFDYRPPVDVVSELLCDVDSVAGRRHPSWDCRDSYPEVNR